MVGTMLSAASTIQAGGKALPVNSRPFGKSYAQWSAEWWKWCYSLPVDRHPLFDTADCDEGQSGPVWFLGGTFTVLTGENGEVIGRATRDCTIPVGKALFFPILNNECSTVEGNGETEAELRDCAEFFATGVLNPNSNLRCTIDGRRVENLQRHKVGSPLFTYGPLPDNNILESFGLDAPEGTTSPAVSDGIWVMVAPLSRGRHTIQFSGSAIFTQEEHGFDFVFTLDITYHLTVGE